MFSSFSSLPTLQPSFLLFTFLSSLTPHDTNMLFYSILFYFSFSPKDYSYTRGSSSSSRNQGPRSDRDPLQPFRSSRSGPVDISSTSEWGTSNPLHSRSQGCILLPFDLFLLLLFMHTSYPPFLSFFLSYLCPFLLSYLSFSI